MNFLANWYKEPTHWKRPWCWERLRVGGEGADRRWDGWMVSSTQLLLLCRFSVSDSLQPHRRQPTRLPVPGILQARTLEWVAISFSNASKWKVKGKLLSHVWLSATPWTAAYQTPPSMGFSRQEYWSGVPLPSPKWSLACCILLQSSSYQPLQKQGKLLGRWWKSYDGSQTIMRIHLLLLITTVSRHI